MCRRSLAIGGIFLCFTLAASAQTPPPEAMMAARSLVATMKLGDQYKALLPAILLRIKPLVTQERAELESDYDLIVTKVGDLYAPYYNEMLEQAATVYAANFTLDEMRQMEAFFRQPGWTKADRKMASDYAANRADRSGCQPQGCRGVAAAPDRCAAPERPQVELAFRVHIRCFLRRDLTTSGLNDPTCVRFWRSWPS